MPADPAGCPGVREDALAEHDWAELLTAEDRRGPTPLFCQHVLPYGEVKLDMTARLNVRTSAPPGGVSGSAYDAIRVGR